MHVIIVGKVNKGLKSQKVSDYGGALLYEYHP